MIFGYNPRKSRKDFEILSKDLIYFDSACMALKPKQVVDAMSRYYDEFPACGGRSAHHLARKVDEEVAAARTTARKFLSAKHDEEIVFTRNTTEGINIVANTLNLAKGDEIIITDKEHNSNLIPWLKLKKKGIKLKIVPSKKDNTFDLEAYEKLLSDKTKLVSVVHTSNLDGVTSPAEKIIEEAHKKGALVMLDAAQSAPHKPLSVKKLDVDFLSLSGHKLCGPTGTGVLYGKKEQLEKMEQFLVGGETVIDSTYEDYKPEKLPMKFEAGLQDYAGIIGLGAAFKYVGGIGLNKIQKHELKLNTQLSEALAEVDEVKLIGPKDPKLRSGVYSFMVEGKKPHNVANMLNASKNICVRSGAHCVHSWFNKHDLPGSVRASLYLYNTAEEVETFVSELKKVIKL